MSSPLISWGIFLTAVAAIWFITQRQKTPTPPAAVSHVTEKAKAVFTETKDAAPASKKSKKKKSKSKPAAKPAEQPEPVSPAADASADASDSDVAEEIDIKSYAKSKLSAPKPPAEAPKKSGKKSKKSARDETTVGSSTDPSDMLEPASDKAGVLRIGSPVQPPRQPKQKSAPKEEPGVHASKNQKKKEKQKALKEAARAEQTAAFEAHRKAQRAAEAAAPKPASAPAPAAASAAWKTATGKKSPSVPAPIAQAATLPETDGLLDTFERPASSGSEDQSTVLGGSWESIPPHVQEPEPEWNEVRSKKTRGNKKDGEEARAATPEPVKEVKKEVEAPPIVLAKPKNAGAAARKTAGFETAGAKKDRTVSGSDWSQVDSLEIWTVHPEDD